MGRDQLFIDGRWVASASGKFLPVVNPSTGDAIGRIAAGGAACSAGSAFSSSIASRNSRSLRPPTPASR